VHFEVDTGESDEERAAAGKPAPTEQEIERAVERLAAALAALDDDAIRAAVGGISEQSRAELASQLQLPRPTMHLGTALPSLLRRKLRGATATRQLKAAFTLSEAVNDDTVHALGAKHDDPSIEDLQSVLPPVVEDHGIPIVTVMLAAYAASDAPAREVASRLLDIDDRFVVGPAIADDEAHVGVTAGVREPLDP